ncbi:hypothetical protein HUU53_03090 [Candidatus Micrarchaeota archaeon]|nr:hypothetical protein [Candidatus Micrarchaeota archaeon]
MMREKKRYLLYKLVGQKLDEKKAKHLVYEAVFSFLGEKTAGKAGASLKEFNPEKQLLVLRCDLKYLEQIIAALALKRFFEGRDIALRLEKISGSVSNLI